jgi:hypothetical protein
LIRKLVVLAATCAIGAGAVPGARADLPATLRSIVDEARFGVIVHDIAARHSESNTVDINLELVSPRLVLFRFEDQFWHRLINPRFVLGGNINTRGFTNFVYGAVSFDIVAARWLVISPQFGFAIHDSPLAGRPGSRKLARLGTRVLGRFGVDFGFPISERWTTYITYQHVSNAIFGNQRHNDSMEFIGVRVGFRF